MQRCIHSFIVHHSHVELESKLWAPKKNICNPMNIVLTMGGGSIVIALLHRNRVHLTLSIVTQMCSLSYITYQCHFAIYVRDPSLRNNTYPFKPYLQELFSLALMSLQAKPSLKSLREIAPPILLLSFLPLVANNLNQISTTNHQQGCQPICILSKC